MVFVTKNIYKWNSTYLGKQKHLAWDVNTLISQHNKMYQPMVEPIDQALTTGKETTFTPTRRERTKLFLGSIRHHEPVRIPFCADYDPDQDEREQKN